jgi:hypothetical protein
MRVVVWGEGNNTRKSATGKNATMKRAMLLPFSIRLLTFMCAHKNLHPSRKIFHPVSTPPSSHSQPLLKNLHIPHPSLSLYLCISLSLSIPRFRRVRVGTRIVPQHDFTAGRRRHHATAVRNEGALRHLAKRLFQLPAHVRNTSQGARGQMIRRRRKKV